MPPLQQHPACCRTEFVGLAASSRILYQSAHLPRQICSQCDPVYLSVEAPSRLCFETSALGPSCTSSISAVSAAAIRMTDNSPIPPDTDLARQYLIPCGILAVIGMSLCTARIITRLRPSPHMYRDDYIIIVAAVWQTLDLQSSLLMSLGIVIL